MNFLWEERRFPCADIINGTRQKNLLLEKIVLHNSPQVKLCALVMMMHAAFLFGWSKTLSWTLTLLSSLRCNRREEKKNLQLNYHHFVTICFCACKEPRRLPVIWLPKKNLLESHLKWPPFQLPNPVSINLTQPLNLRKFKFNSKITFFEEKEWQTTKSFLDFKAFWLLRSPSQNANQDKKREIQRKYA